MLKTLAACAAMLLFVGTALAADTPATPATPPPEKLQRFPNATVVKFDGKSLAVTTADGKPASIAFNADTMVLRNRQGTKADLKPGVFVGCTAVEGPDHKLRATEIRVFPESMRGLGEGHYPWPVDNPEPNTTMTNGNVDTVQGVTDGNVIKVSYKGGVTEIEIPNNVPILVTELVGGDQLKPGAKINITAVVNADGSFTAKYIRILV